jgi:hypothetical protein
MIPVLILIAIFAAALGWNILRWRGLDRCVIPYLIQSRRRRPLRAGDQTHLLLCVVDHFEPQWGKAPAALAQQRVRNWVRQYPSLFGGFRDSDGRPPRHTFFFPIDQYDAQHVQSLAELCRQGFGEIEIHLHHERDTAANLRRTIEQYKLLLAARHGLLAKRRTTGEIVYGFVHGDWALDNSRGDGRCCGVNNELDVLRQTGCYADFTLPSAPSSTQTRKINSIYYAKGNPDRPKSHDWGINVGAADAAPSDSLMLIQGPLLLDWRRGKIENGCLQASQPPDTHRLDLWLKANVHVPSRPDWRFVKLHAHGAPEANQEILLGQAMLEFHRGLRRRADAEKNFHFHYVSAREMYNLVKAAEAGYAGPVAPALDFDLIPNVFQHPIVAAV